MTKRTRVAREQALEFYEKAVKPRMNKEGLNKVQMASIQLILKVDGEKMEVKIMTFGEESLPAEHRNIVEVTAKILHDVFLYSERSNKEKGGGMKVILEGAEAEKYAFAVKLFNLDRALELSEEICDNPHINNELKDALRAFLEECKYINAKRKEHNNG